jgi:hypothetical protein
LELHAKGQGARLIAVIQEAGIKWELVRRWNGGRNLERRLKNWHNASQLCPICSGDDAYSQGNFNLNTQRQYLTFKPEASARTGRRPKSKK